MSNTFMGYWAQNSDAWQAIGSAATVLAAMVAAFALIGAVWQVAATRRIAKESGALETHREYLRLCIEYPHLSSSPAMLAHMGRNNFRGILDECTADGERALWFLSYVLNTMEQLFEKTQDNSIGREKWRALIWDQLRYHYVLLEEVWTPEWSSHYGDEFAHFVSCLLRNPSNTSYEKDLIGARPPA